MSDVACVFGPLTAELEARGLPAALLVGGLGIDSKELSNPRRRIPWDAFAELARRASELLGSDVLEDVAARATEEAVPDLFRRVLPRLGNARSAYLMGARWWGPWIFRSTRSTCELADGRIREVIEILPGYRECPEFFHGVRGLLRATPRLFGQPEAVVELETDGRRGEFIISTPPTRRGLFGRRRHGALSALPDELEELGFRQEQLRESERRARAAVELLAQKSGRLEALVRLGAELAGNPDLHARMRAALRLLERQLSVRGIRLSAMSRLVDEDRPDLCAETGDVSGRRSSLHPLFAGERLLGRLELWGHDGQRTHDLGALAELLPWIVVALDGAGSQERVRRLTRMLEEQVGDWGAVDRAVEEALRDVNSILGPPEVPDATETILLVHDDELRRRRLRGVFQGAGYQVVEVGTGLAEQLRAHTAAGTVEWAVLDWSFGSERPEILHEIRRLHPELRGVLLLPLDSR